MSSTEEAARDAAEQRWPIRNVGPQEETYPRSAVASMMRGAFESGAAWQREQPSIDTDDAVMRAASALMRDDPAAEDGTYGLDDYVAMARAALSAAREVGHA